MLPRGDSSNSNSNRNSSNSNSNSNSNSERNNAAPAAAAPQEPAMLREILEPRSVSEFLLNFTRALEEHFNTDDPGRTEVYHFIGDFVGPNNKRRAVFYVAHSDIATARRITRIEYVMPVAPIPAALLFGGDGVITLPAEGPLINIIDIPEGQTAQEYVAATIAATMDAAAPLPQRLALWDSEITRVEAIRDLEGENEVRRRAAANIIAFWMNMRRELLNSLYAVYIRVQRPGRELSPPLQSPNAVVEAVNIDAPVAPVMSESSERRRWRPRRRSTPRRKTTDPSPLNRYDRDPVTGKRTRRRRPNSDPKDD
jgi:hypothetical protein